MTRLRITLLVALALLTAAPAGAKEARRYFTPATAHGGRVYYDGGIPIAVLAGTPEQIGRQHGELLEQQAKATIDYAKEFAQSLWPVTVAAGQALLLNAPEAHRQELAAISAHSSLGVGELAVANTMLELRRMGCSALVVEPEQSATGAPIFGRNFDFPSGGVLDKYGLVIIEKPTGKRAFASIGFPGAVGVFSGMNDAGLALGTLDVEECADGSAKFDLTGAPLAFVFRRILEECATVDEAEKLLGQIKATTWMNLALCDRNGGAIFEITPKHVIRRDDGGSHVVCCTNHFESRELDAGDMDWRLPLLETAKRERPLDVEAVHRHMDAVNQGEMSLQTMIFEPRELVVHVALGEPPVTDDPLTRIELAPLFKLSR